MQGGDLTCKSDGLDLGAEFIATMLLVDPIWTKGSETGGGCLRPSRDRSASGDGSSGIPHVGSFGAIAAGGGGGGVGGYLGGMLGGGASGRKSEEFRGDGPRSGKHHRASFPELPTVSEGVGNAPDGHHGASENGTPVEKKTQTASAGGSPEPSWAQHSAARHPGEVVVDIAGDRRSGTTPQQQRPPAAKKMLRALCAEDDDLCARVLKMTLKTVSVREAAASSKAIPRCTRAKLVSRTVSC